MYLCKRSNLEILSELTNNKENYKDTEIKTAIFSHNLKFRFTNNKQ